MRINREHLLSVLESVGVGVARTPSFQQAGCLVFDKGKVITFNGDVACQGESPLNGVYGAVAASTLMEYLRKLTEEELDVTSEEGVLKIKGKGRRMKFAMEKEIHLPLESIEPPKEWQDLHEDFCEAAGMVAECAGKDEKFFTNTCVNVHPKWLEAYDGSQLMRHRLKTGVKEAFLVQRTAMKQVCVMGMTQWAITDRWVHFKNSSNYILSCVRFPELVLDDLTLALTLEGEKVNLPKGLSQAAVLAELASKESKDDNVLSITLKPGEVWIKGQGIVTEYEERRKFTYSGPEMTFSIAPALLAVLADKYNEARVTKGRLIVDGGKWRYVVMLKLPEE